MGPALNDTRLAHGKLWCQVGPLFVVQNLNMLLLKIYLEQFRQAQGNHKVALIRKKRFSAWRHQRSVFSFQLPAELCLQPPTLCLFGLLSPFQLFHNELTNSLIN